MESAPPCCVGSADYRCYYAYAHDVIVNNFGKKEEGRVGALGRVGGRGVKRGRILEMAVRHDEFRSGRRRC